MGKLFQDTTYSQSTTPTSTIEQQAKQPSPLSIIVMAVLMSSGALMLVGFALRVARMDGNLDEAVQWGIGGMLVPWVLLGVGCIGLIVREFVYLIEATTHHDLTGDGNVGRPVALLDPYKGREALATDKARRELSLWEAFVRGCETHTSWTSWRDTINRPTWKLWRDNLIACGWAEKENPDQENSAWHLTAPASAILAGVHQPEGER